MHNYDSFSKIIGAGESGKSTLSKQMRLIYVNGYTDEERKTIIPSVHANVLSNIKDILRGVNKFKLVLPTDVQVCTNTI